MLTSLRLLIVLLVLGVSSPAFALPDLRFGSTPVVPTVVAHGDLFTITGIRVVNSGTVIGGNAGPSKIGHFLTDASGSTLLGTTDVPSLSRTGQFVVPPVTLPVPASQAVGTYTLQIRLDYLDDVNESNESNNVFIRPLEITIRVDLTFASQPTWSEPILLGDGPIDVSSFEIDNLSLLGFDGSFTVMYVLTDDPGGLTTLSVVGSQLITAGPADFPVTVPGITCNVLAPAPTDPGPHYLVTLIDSADVVVEEDETNNKSDAVPINFAYVPWTSVFTADIGGQSGSGGVAWGDYDNDGDHDLFVARDGFVLTENDELLRNDGAGGWTASPVPFNFVGNGRGVVWGDLDDDGWLDLYVTRGAISAEPNRVFRNMEGGSFQSYAAFWTGLDDPGLGASVTMSDFDRDGDLDPFVSNASCSGCPSPVSHLFENIGGTFQSLTDPDIEYPECTQGSAWADYDNDGDPDVFVTGAWDPLAGDSACSGYSRLLRNDGGGVFTSLSATYFFNSAYDRGCAWGDYDNDGFLDLVVAGDRGTFLYHNEGGTGFLDVTNFALPDRFDGTSVCWLDHDLDGDLDLYVGGPTSQPSHLLRNEGAGWFADVTLAPVRTFSPTIGAATADFDDDGDLDLYVNHSHSSDLLLRNDQATGHHWLQIDLRGTVSNHFGVGARVELQTADGWQMREVEGGSGWLSQNSLTLEFGLGDQTEILRLIVRWPSGIVQDFSPALPIDKRITILESDSGATGIDLPEVAWSLQLDAPSPNPFNPRTTLRFEVADDGPVSLTVFDASGRRVRSLLSGHVMSAGSHTMVWNGRDDRGRDVSSGTYYCRLETESGSRTQKAALVR